MADRLATIARTTSPLDDSFQSPRVAELLRGLIAKETDEIKRVRLRGQLATILVEASQPREAIAEIEALQALPQETRAAAGPDFDWQLRDTSALAWLRSGELENCVNHHGTESCLLPIRGGGIHHAQEGSRKAIEILEGMLADRPDDVTSRWLLNVACMTVGDYPDGVPARWLIPPKAFDSEHDVGRFVDVAKGAGLAAQGLSGGAVMEDFDGDGLLDVMTSSWGLDEQVRLFMSRGDGTFEETTEAAGLTGLLGGLNLVQADFDNDGDVDVFIPRGAWLGKAGHIPNSLLRNDGNGRFTDVTEAAGILTSRPTQVGAWADYDGDGLLDLFVGNESRRDDPHPCELWHGETGGTFTDASASLGNPVLGFVKGASWGDMDDDGRPDLYVSILGGANLLFRNGGSQQPSGAWTFTEVGAAAGVTEPSLSFPTWWWDYDDDGRLDVFVAGFRQGIPGAAASLYLGKPNPDIPLPRLYRNRGDGTFEDVTRAARLDRVTAVMGANHGDIDGDGWEDCYLGTGTPDLRALIPNRMFRNDRGRAFQDVTTSGGFGHLQKGHGVAFGDIDGDGDQDVYEDIGGAVTGDVGQNVLFENPGHGTRWLTLRLRGTLANRGAIGARLRVRVATPSGPRDIHALCGTGGSFGGNSLQQEIGLGDATAILETEVRWPLPGAMQVFRGMGLDRAYDLTEGEPEAMPRALKTFHLPPPADLPAATPEVPR